MTLWKYTRRRVLARDSHGQDLAFYKFDINLNRSVVVGVIWYHRRGRGQTDTLHLLVGCFELRLERVADPTSEPCLCAACRDLAGREGSDGGGVSN